MFLSVIDSKRWCQMDKMVDETCMTEYLAAIFMLYLVAENGCKNIINKKTAEG